MKFIDPHIHCISRTTDDYLYMARAGVVAVSEPAFWAGYDRSSASSFADYFRHLMHVDPDEWNTAMSPGGALEAAIEARDEGLTRFIGVTGHGVTVAAQHLRSLERFAFDSVLLPYNYPMMQNAAYANDFEELMTVCKERSIAVQTIKAVTRSPWGEKEHTHITWYEPLTEQPDIDLAARWVFARPGVFLNTAGDLTLLPKLLEASERADGPPSEAEMRDLADRRTLEPLFV